MKPYIDLEGKKIYLPQSVDAHNFEICVMGDFFLLCKKVTQRYSQATGVLMERSGKELIFHKSVSSYFLRTFPLNKSEFYKINIDYQANNGPISIVHEE